MSSFVAWFLIPNPIPDIEDHGDYLSKFRGDDEEILAKHSINFHECMHQLGIFNEDVLMKIFMISLYGDAWERYRYLPTTRISSLKDFHVEFHSYYKRI